MIEGTPSILPDIVSIGISSNFNPFTLFNLISSLIFPENKPFKVYGISPLIFPLNCPSNLGALILILFPKPGIFPSITSLSNFGVFKLTLPDKPGIFPSFFLPFKLGPLNTVLSISKLGISKSKVWDGFIPCI